jgi:hypothetical protein
VNRIHYLVSLHVSVEPETAISEWRGGRRPILEAAGAHRTDARGGRAQNEAHLQALAAYRPPADGPLRGPGALQAAVSCRDTAVPDLQTLRVCHTTQVPRAQSERLAAKLR